MTTTTGRFQQRYDTANNWQSNNTLLLEGELGVTIDTYEVKLGNGLDLWNDAPFPVTDPVSIGDYGDVDLDFVSPSDGNVFIYLNSKWRPGPVLGVLDLASPPNLTYSIDGFDDVDISTVAPVADQTLVWDVSQAKWLPKDFTSKFLTSVTPPATSTSSGISGDIRFNSSFVYVCVASNTWKRAPLAGW